MNPANADKPFRILFLCTGNTARSVLAEYLIRKFGGTRFESFSAGANPKGVVNPYTLRVLGEIHGMDASAARSKSWEEFAGRDLDFVITVCDRARETCPVFPGQPVTAHWSFPDPADFAGSEAETFDHFAKIALHIQKRVELLCALPFDKLDHLRLEQRTREIGRE